jgi:hypothetical protein
MVLVPAFPLVFTLIVIVEVPEPGAAMVLGLKLADCAPPSPEADKVIGELKPLSTAVVIVNAPEFPVDTAILAGDAAMVKSASAGTVTVSVTVVRDVMLSPTPVTVIG